MTTPCPAAQPPGRAQNKVAPVPRRRDASNTTQLLLDAARARFARHGYQATTVRDICDDAGVNVALISRYFGSKEQLFRACVASMVRGPEDSVPENATAEQIADAMAVRLAASDPVSYPHQLLLLLRSSQDPEAEKIRLDTLRSFAERLAAAGGWTPEGPDAGRHLLNAQITLSALLGISLLRATSTLQPLVDAGQYDLQAPLRRLVGALVSD